MGEARHGPITAEDFAASLNNKQLHCRELGHTWRPLTVTFDEQARAYDRKLRCTNCRTVRTQTLDSHGHVLSNSYAYADGYLAVDVEHGAGRDAYRVESVIRFLTSHSTDNRKTA